MECTVRNIPVYYESFGSGTPVVMIHGFSPDHRLMKGCMEPLFTRLSGWQRIYFDLPGMGRTPGSPEINSTDDMLEVVLEFIEAVIPGQRFLVTGESYGGYLARGVVARKFDLVDGMVLICPVIVAEHSQRDVPPPVSILKNPELLASLAPGDAEAFGPLSVVQDRYNWERFRDEVLCGLRLADEAFLQKIEQRYAFSFEVDDLPQPFSKPVVVLAGRQDSSVGYRDSLRLLEKYRRGTFAILDRAGHNLQFEQPELFEALVKEWLDRVLEGMP